MNDLIASITEDVKKKCEELQDMIFTKDSKGFTELTTFGGVFFIFAVLGVLNAFQKKESEKIK